jgi:hypothetical protein
VHSAWATAEISPRHREQLDDPRYIPEPRKEVGASERTLNALLPRAFRHGGKALFAAVPHAHGQADAAQKSPGQTTVTEIVTRYSFSQFGREAVEYNAIFEGPSTMCWYDQFDDWIARARELP